MTLYEIVKKLIGPICATGEHNTDQARFENLEATIDLIDHLLGSLELASRDADRPEASMAKIGKRAQEFLQEEEV